MITGADADTFDPVGGDVLAQGERRCREECLLGVVDAPYGTQRVVGGGLQGGAGADVDEQVGQPLRARFSVLGGGDRVQEVSSPVSLSGVSSASTLVGRPEVRGEIFRPGRGASAAGRFTCRRAPRVDEFRQCRQRSRSATSVYGPLPEQDVLAGRASTFWGGGTPF